MSFPVQMRSEATKSPRDETEELVAVVRVGNTEADLGLPEEDAAGRRVAVVAGEEEGETGAGGVAPHDADDGARRLEEGKNEMPELEEHLPDPGARLSEGPVEIDAVGEELVAAAKHRPAGGTARRLDCGREFPHDCSRQRVGASADQAEPHAAVLVLERDVRQAALRRLDPRGG